MYADSWIRFWYQRAKKNLCPITVFVVRNDGKKMYIVHTKDVMVRALLEMEVLCFFFWIEAKMLHTYMLWKRFSVLRLSVRKQTFIYLIASTTTIASTVCLFVSQLTIHLLHPYKLRLGSLNFLIKFNPRFTFGCCASRSLCFFFIVQQFTKPK